MTAYAGEHMSAVHGRCPYCRRRVLWAVVFWPYPLGTYQMALTENELWRVIREHKVECRSDLSSRLT